MTVLRKLVMIGDSKCGKTCLLTRISRGHYAGVFPYYIPTCQPQNELYETKSEHGDTIQLSLWDTAAHEDYDRLRALSYDNAHIILLCFSIDSPHTLRNIEKKWVVEMREHCGRIPFILVGCKMDVRQNPDLTSAPTKTHRSIVSSNEGAVVAQRLGASHYLECSSLTGNGVESVFARAALAAADVPDRRAKGKGGHCVVL